jgi:NAD(P)H-hydrate epimerase
MDHFGVPGIVLMENAGRGMAELLVKLGVGGPVLVCCGKGNNGGDGFVIARHLDNAGVPVRVLLFADPAGLGGDAATNHAILARSGFAIEQYADPLDEARLRSELSQANWVVDALFGSGLQGPVRPPLDRVIEAINASPATVFAVDIPSGLDADTGQPLGPTVRAHHTGTVVALKKGFVEPAAQPWLGQVHLIDMGAPRQLVESFAQSIGCASGSSPG